MEEETGMEVGRGVGRSGGEGREVGDGGEVWEGEGDGEEGEEVSKTPDPFSSIFLEKWVVKKFSSGAHLRESYFPPFKHFLSHQARQHPKITSFLFFLLYSFNPNRSQGPLRTEELREKRKEKELKKKEKRKRKNITFLEIFYRIKKKKNYFLSLIWIHKMGNTKAWQVNRVLNGSNYIYNRAFAQALLSFARPSNLHNKQCPSFCSKTDEPFD